jgi:hypothetical protein
VPDGMAAARVNPLRPGRSHPRRLLGHRKKYPPLREGDRRRCATPELLLT